MNEDRQLVDERRITDSLKLFKRYPGLSISLEPDPQSGNPDVKVTDLNTGTPIATHTPKTYHRSSLETLGRKLQLAEGLKCALNNTPLSNVSELVDPNVSKHAGYRDEGQDYRTIRNTDMACDIVVKKPINEILQRSSMGINLALNHEDDRNTVRPRSFVIHDPTFHMQWQNEAWSTGNGFKTQEPIRLPREDSLAALARAIEEELASRLPMKEACDVNKCSGIKEEIMGEDLSKEAVPCMNLSESGCKEVEASDMVRPVSETLNANNNSHHGLGLGEDTKECRARFESEKERTNNDGMLTMLRKEAAANNVAPCLDLNNDVLICNMTALEIPSVNTNSISAVDNGFESTKSTDIVNPAMLGAHDVDPIQNAKCTPLEVNSSNGNTKTREMLGPISSSMKMLTHDVPLKSTDATLICESFAHEFTSMKSNQATKYYELPLLQRETKIVRPAPTLLDTLNLDIPQLEADNKMSTNSMSSHCEGVAPCKEDIIEPCALYMCMKAGDSIQYPMNPLNILQCRLCSLETSQELELLKTHIKHRSCLMALQLCLFAWVVFWGGLVDMLATPPPT